MSEIVGVYRKTASDWNPVVRQPRLRNPQESLAFVQTREKKEGERARLANSRYAALKSYGSLARASDLQNEDGFIFTDDKVARRHSCDAVRGVTSRLSFRIFVRDLATEGLMAMRSLVEFCNGTS